MTSFLETMRSFNAIKAEHVPDEMFQPRGDLGTVEDEALARLLAKGVRVDDAQVAGSIMVDALMRALRRTGRLRGANQTHLHSALYSAWLDGLGVGLHHEP